MAQSPNKEIWFVIGGQGLRGSDFGVVWRWKMGLPHWKPGRRIAKSINS
jgi:hypothetical protein